MEDDVKMKCGLEIHVQVDTESKLFCRCPTNYKDVPPNTNICPVCMGLPGAKPMPPNKKAVDVAIMVAKMLGCDIVIDKDIYFQRKHYDYPDLPSGYQRTSVPIGVNGNFMGVGITEVHLEEDPGQYKPDLGLVDYNRSGTPLIEIVTEPDIKSPEEAREFLKQLMRLFRYIGCLRGEGSMRADVNISINYKGVQGNRVEVKNVNSIRGVYKVLRYELIRQKNIIRRGGKVKRETRAFLESQMITKSMREKETAEDYRYIPDPDIQPIVIDEKWVKEVEEVMPETPLEKEKRFVKEYNIREDDAKVLVSDLELADAFEKVVAGLGREKENINLAVTWIRNELKRVLQYNKIDFFESNIKVEHLIELIKLIKDKVISQKIGKKVIELLVENRGEKSPKQIIDELGLTVISDEDVLERACEEAIKNNPKAVEDYLSGNKPALNFLMGQVMKLTRGRAEPKKVVEILKKKLDNQ
ncbi:Asp-tRNA(Asn)/Glu-tRNA(Gln) amidotransferase subunit GatB [Methanotorris formicicus]|uniref:Aspartyl/glutamyl-tRNA(Asn/Gln) amidotransferase subunit B n=1 Tax=Methanotorris formicicus Mc-S-70 TaxID=647171 RepID=H1KZI9_9EURY|nr:Asp-tRNA(Asn)/Glu-tRNA(Gln) amidotransferase subunit GatB [Methanotorris formicicus]EHP85882.1 glutamyl-tRNA(Gln) amidotransferase, B subunit [Methanotorris formicicus Mc-S-70]